MIATPVNAGLENVERFSEQRIVVDGNDTLSVVLNSLESFTKYRIEVSAFTNGGDGPRIATYAGTET